MSAINKLSAVKIVSVLLTGMLLVSITGCSKKTEKKNLEGSIISSDLLVNKSTTYSTEKITPESLIKTSEADTDPSYVFSKNISTGNKEYILSELRVSRNQNVKKGDIIAVLQGTGKESDVRELKLQIESYKANSEETAEKMAALVEEEASKTTENKYDEEIVQLKVKKAQAAYDAYVLNANYTLDGMIEKLDKAEADLSVTNITSPIDGIVKSVVSGCKPGDRLKANTVLYVINDANAILYYSNSTSGAFVYNREVTLKVGRGEKELTVKGRVVSSPEVAPGKTFGGGIYVAVNQADLKYGAGRASMTVEYVMLKNAFLVEKTALGADEGVPFVMLLDGNTIKKRYILRGPDAGTKTTAIQGLYEGDEVILSSYNTK